ncbi:DUF4181 domain-containing protein [Gottfriedia sp. NPDC056225]|uniref:DUF4181 domain-containing protein n=1 Tax=Gottfriedia sp. NPDC056225 TaxID=3345751 RepID=UPI0035DD77E8
MYILKIAILLGIASIGIFSEWLLRRKLDVNGKMFTYSTVNNFHKMVNRLLLLFSFIISLLVDFKEIKFISFINVWFFYLIIQTFFQTYMQWKYQKGKKEYIISLAFFPCILITFISLKLLLN